MNRVCTALSGAILLTSLLTSYSSAQIVVDGELDASGYRLITTQTNQTQFGDANAGNNFQGSELDAMYATVEDSRIFVMLTGNLEGNFNKLEIFFDTASGGENVLSSTPQYDFCCINEGGTDYWNSQFLGGPVSMEQGLTFDSGFQPDYHMFVRRGFIGEEPFNIFDASFVNRMGGGAAMVPGNENRAAFDFDLQTGVGSIEPGDLGPNASGAAIANSIAFAINNNNDAGVGGYDGKNPIPADPVAAEAVTTGIEFSIALADLGLDPEQPGTVKIVAFVNNSDHRFVSNQVLPGLPAPMANLGGDNLGGFIGDLGLVNFEVLAGDQFACINYCAFAVGDVDQNGEVSLTDVTPFVNLLSTGGFLCEADINGDGTVSLLDVSPFVQLLSGN